MPVRHLPTGLEVWDIPEENIYSYGDQSGLYNVYLVCDEFLVCTHDKTDEDKAKGQTDEATVYLATVSTDPVPTDRGNIVEIAPALYADKEFTKMWVRGQGYDIQPASVFYVGRD